MARILAIDYGQKRVGLAVTDPAHIIATALDTVATKDLLQYISNYIKREPIECFVVGLPRDLHNRDCDATKFVEPFVKILAKTFPNIPIERVDERFTSKIAFQTMIAGGMKKSDRRNKGEIDKISAVLILQTYLEQKTNR